MGYLGLGDGDFGLMPISCFLRGARPNDRALGCWGCWNDDTATPVAGIVTRGGGLLHLGQVGAKPRFSDLSPYRGSWGRTRLDV